MSLNKAKIGLDLDFERMHIKYDFSEINLIIECFTADWIVVSNRSNVPHRKISGLLVVEQNPQSMTSFH